MYFFFLTYDFHPEVMSPASRGPSGSLQGPEENLLEFVSTMMSLTLSLCFWLFLWLGLGVV